MDSRYKLLARRMVLTVLAVALVPLWLVGGVIFHYFAAVHRSELKGQLGSLLSISHSIMQQLGGSLSFDSRPGQGATFFVRIPHDGVQ
jgi:hypothetical protein